MNRRTMYLLVCFTIIMVIGLIVVTVQVSTERDQARHRADKLQNKLEDCKAELFNVKKQNLTLDQIMVGAKIFIDHQMDENEKLKNLLEQCDCER